jgi:hypothetical protein
VFALRMSNDNDQNIVKSAVSDTGSGLLEFLPALGQREAIAFGDGVTLPVRIKFDELPKNALPRSSTARFSERWQTSVENEVFLDQVVERWRISGAGASAEGQSQTSMFAETLNLGASDEAPAAPAGAPAGGHKSRDASDALASRLGVQAGAARRDVGRRDGTQAPVRTGSGIRRGEAEPAAAPAQPASSQSGFRSIRDRLLQRQ